MIPKPFKPSSVSTSTNTNIRLSIDLPMFGRSISCRWREAEIDPIFIRALRSALAPMRSPSRDQDGRRLSYMMATDGRTLRREDRQ